MNYWREGYQRGLLLLVVVFLLYAFHLKTLFDKKKTEQGRFQYQITKRNDIFIRMDDNFLFIIMFIP